MYFLDLPHELLTHVLEALEDYELYRCSSLCRALNQLSLDVLFKRYPLDIDIPSGVVDLRYYTGKTSSPIILPALDRAVYLRTMPTVMVELMPIMWAVNPENRLKILKDIVVRGRCNELLWIDLRMMASPRAYQPISQSLRDLVEVSLQNGCADLKITNGNGFESLLYPPCPNFPISGSTSQKKSATPSKRLLRYLGQLLTRKREVSETGTVTSLEDPPSPSPSWASQNTYFSDVDGVQDTRYPNAMNKGSVELSADFFTPTWLDWTLSIINHTTLVRLTIQATTSSRCHYHMWYDVLPKIYTPCLETFHFSGSGLSVQDFAWFLSRHSATLKNLRLHFCIPGSSLPCSTSRRGSVSGCVKPSSSKSPPVAGNSASVSDHGYTDVPKIHLPSLRSLSFSPPLQFPAFVKLLKIPYAPKLVSVEILPHLAERDTSETDLDDVLRVLGKFIAKRNGYIASASTHKLNPIPSEVTDTTSACDRQKPWLSQLVIVNIVSLAWIKAHSIKSVSNPLSGLSTIERLNIHTNKLGTTSEIIVLLPQFLSNLSQLKHFGRLWMDLEDAKSLGRDYWKEMTRCCPRLEKVQFQFGVMTALNFQMVDLVAGTVTWPD